MEIYAQRVIVGDLTVAQLQRQVTFFSTCMGHIILDSSECDNELFMYFVKHYIGEDSRPTSNYPISIQARQFMKIFVK